MWCDNCLLLLPLRAGAIAWAAIIVLYSLVGGVFLFKWGDFLFLTYPEWEIYGGIAFIVAFLAFINALALSNRSYIWTRACKFSWPIVIVLSAIRAIAMIVELYRYRTEIVWECENGGQLRGSPAENGSTSTTTMPNSLCTPGWSSLFTIFIVSLLVDLAFQLYMLFLNWRFSKRLEHYNNMKGPFQGGYYNA